MRTTGSKPGAQRWPLPETTKPRPAIMPVSADALTDLLASRIPQLPREALAELASAIIDVCDEARAEEREACAQMVDRIAEESRIAAANFAAIDEPQHAERHVNYRERAMAIAVAIRERD